jgi:hypothetical protein
MRPSIFSSLRLAALCGSVVFLSGCEGVSAVGESLKNIEMPSMPSFHSKDKAKDAAPASSLAASAGGPTVSGVTADCPAVQALPEVSRITRFMDETKPVLADLVTTATLSSVSTSCVSSGNSVTVELSLSFDGTLGPAGQKENTVEATYSFPYFIAVVNPSGTIMSKDVFALGITYGKGQTAIGKPEVIRQIIPVAAGTGANAYQIMVGFQLTDAELAYNRSAK